MTWPAKVYIDGEPAELCIVTGRGDAMPATEELLRSAGFMPVTNSENYWHIRCQGSEHRERELGELYKEAAEQLEAAMKVVEAAKDVRHWAYPRTGMQRHSIEKLGAALAELDRVRGKRGTPADNTTKPAEKP